VRQGSAAGTAAARWLLYGGYGLSHRAIDLARKFNLVLLIDQTPAARGKKKPQYMVDDETPKLHIDRHLPNGHWVVHRSIRQPRLVPRSGI
jgi:hypothetical protein